MHEIARYLPDEYAMRGDGQEYRLHHVGFVVADITASISAFATSLGASWDGSIFEDKHQRVRVAFLITRCSDPRFELVAPADESSPVINFLEKSGGGLHHVCYEVPDLEQALLKFKSRKATLAKRPLPAVAFNGRRIAWILTREKLLVELLEQKSRQAFEVCPGD